MARRKKIKKGCVISGGGAWGAFGAGTLARLNEDYDVVAGISTGALMSPLVALKDWETLKEAYTSVNQHSIFDCKWYRPNPFKKDGRPKIIAIIYALLFGHKTIGTTKAMRKTIDKFINEEQFTMLSQLDKELIVGAQNLRQNPSLVQYFNSKDWDVEDFKDWMWASANAPFFTSLIDKEWHNPNNPSQLLMGQWTDGGLTELIALDEVYNQDVDEIDVIVHRNIKTMKYESDEICNLVDNVTTSIDAMRYDIEFEYFIGKIKYFNSKGVKVRVWWLPRKLSNNSLMFDKKQMTEWWNEGYETAFDEERLIIYEPTNQ